MKILITGITGQDGSYLSEILLSKGHEVHGVVRRSSFPNTQRIDHIFDPESKQFLHYGDLEEGIDHLLYSIKPDWVINLAAQSHVRVSFDVPVYSLDVNGVGVCRILEGIRRGIETGILSKDIKYYQASSSEIFGTSPPPQSETTSFQPSSPYGIAKLCGYWLTKRYREGYNMFASNGILFNHESPRRGVNFVTRKITRIAVKIYLRLMDKIELGNLDAKRDFSHSKDLMRAVTLIMENSYPDDWVVASGESITIRDFAERVFDYFNLKFDDYLVTNDAFKRPVEVPYLLGDPTKIKTILGWKPEYNLDSLIKEMCDSDYKEISEQYK